MEAILEKLRKTIENPGFYHALTPEEQAELFLFLFAPKPKLFQKPKVIQGIDGKTPEKDRDYLGKETAQKLIQELASKTKIELENRISDRLSQIPVPQDGKDAVITEELIAHIANLAQSMITLPDFPTLITMEPEAIRNALELLPDGEKLAQYAIEGLPEKLQELENKGGGQAGGLSKNAVLKLIEENTTSDQETFEKVSKNLDASDATLNYTGDILTSIDYANGVTKTLNYTGDNLTSVVLSGTTPSGIDLTKTLTYTGENLTGVGYS
jgi:hypothetical protein